MLVAAAPSQCYNDAGYEAHTAPEPRCPAGGNAIHQPRASWQISDLKRAQSGRASDVRCISLPNEDLTMNGPGFQVPTEEEKLVAELDLLGIRYLSRRPPTVAWRAGWKGSRSTHCSHCSQREENGSYCSAADWSRHLNVPGQAGESFPRP